MTLQPGFPQAAQPGLAGSTWRQSELNPRHIEYSQGLRRAPRAVGGQKEWSMDDD
jgi:hypothetical protein